MWSEIPKLLQDVVKCIFTCAFISPQNLCENKPTWEDQKSWLSDSVPTAQPASVGAQSEPVMVGRSPWPPVLHHTTFLQSLPTPPGFLLPNVVCTSHLHTLGPPNTLPHPSDHFSSIPSSRTKSQRTCFYSSCIGVANPAGLLIQVMLVEKQASSEQLGYFYHVDTVRRAFKTWVLWIHLFPPSSSHFLLVLLSFYLFPSHYITGMSLYVCVLRCVQPLVTP